mgnify:CR=1 FL=1
MRADEYDLLIRDPTDFFLRFYLPRVFGALGACQMLDPLTDIVELPFSGGAFVPFGLPGVREGIEKLPVREDVQLVCEPGRALVAEAEALGIDVDGRWSVRRLKLEIAAAKTVPSETEAPAAPEAAG